MILVAIILVVFLIIVVFVSGAITGDKDNKS